MSPELAQYLPYFLVGFVVALLVVWLIARANRKTTIIDDGSAGGDVLDEGASKATRNQALIDSPRSMEQNFGQETANANADTIAAAGATADAEAGASVAPSVVNAPPPPQETTPEPAPAPAPEPVQKPAATVTGDTLTQIKGLGPKIATMLNDQGITTFAQIAAWTDSDIDRVDATLGRFAGRIRRDQWVEQAKLLDSGDADGFDARFGRNT